MHKAAGFFDGYMAKPGHNKEASLEKEARNIADGQASFLKALFPTINVFGEGENVQPIAMKHNWTRRDGAGAPIGSND